MYLYFLVSYEGKDDSDDCMRAQNDEFEHDVQIGSKFSIRNPAVLVLSVLFSAASGACGNSRRKHVFLGRRKYLLL